MPDFTDGMKKLALSAYQNSQPADICYGTVVSGSPLAVCVEELKMTLGQTLLAVPDYLRDWEIPVSVDGKIGAGILPWALRAGDRVILIKKAGGQKYVVLGRKG